MIKIFGILFLVIIEYFNNKLKIAIRRICRIQVAQFLGLKLFGQSYSGLEYDYRGLMHLYQKLEEQDQMFKYTNALAQWRELRDKHVESEDPPIDLHTRPQPIEKVTGAFFAM